MESCALVVYFNYSYIELRLIIWEYEVSGRYIFK